MNPRQLVRSLDTVQSWHEVPIRCHPHNERRVRTQEWRHKTGQFQSTLRNAVIMGKNLSRDVGHGSTVPYGKAARWRVHHFNASFNSEATLFTPWACPVIKPR